MYTRSSQPHEHAALDVRPIAYTGVFSDDARHHLTRSLLDRSIDPNVSIVWTTGLQKNRPDRNPYLLGMSADGLSFCVNDCDLSSGWAYCLGHQQNRFYPIKTGHCTFSNSIFRQRIFHRSCSSDDTYFRDGSRLYCILRHWCI